MSAFIRELVHTGIYKRSQGRITRQITWTAMAITMALGLWRLSEVLKLWNPGFRLGLPDGVFLGGLRYGLPGSLLLIALWIAYRVVNVPSFADFLIAVEAEMNKVSWPTRTELFRASMVVLVTIFVLAALLATYDLVWKLLLRNLLGIY